MKNKFLLKKFENNGVNIFLYPNSPKSPHKVHKTWGLSVCKFMFKTPLGIGKFNIKKIPKTKIILIESLYSIPFAKKIKKRDNCKIIAIISDTSFWEEKLNIFRKVFYKVYLKYIDGFIVTSKRIKKDIEKFSKAPVKVVYPYIVNTFPIKNRKKNNNILFIGEDVEEKGFKYLIEAMKYLPNFKLYLVGGCYKKIKSKRKNIYVIGRVKNLRKYFEKCYFYIHPADFEPFGVVVGEAMFAGLIPIITKNVGISELFTKKLKILILNNNNPKTIAKKIKELYNINDKEIIKECKKLSKKLSKQSSIKNFKKAFIELTK